MILGKSYTQRRLEEQERLKKLYNKKIKVFLWIPKILETGEIRWLEYVWKSYTISKDVVGYRLIYEKPDYNRIEKAK